MRINTQRLAAIAAVSTMLIGAAAGSAAAISKTDGDTTGLIQSWEWDTAWGFSESNHLNTNGKGGRVHVHVENRGSEDRQFIVLEDIHAFDDSWSLQDNLTWDNPNTYHRFDVRAGKTADLEFGVNKEQGFLGWDVNGVYLASENSSNLTYEISRVK